MPDTKSEYNFTENTESLVTETGSVEILKAFTAEETVSEIIIPVPEQKKVRHYMGWAIIAALFGSVLFGIAAIICSVITKARLSAKDIDKAEGWSNHTKLFCLISLAVGIVEFIVIVITLIIFCSISEMPLFLF